MKNPRFLLILGLFGLSVSHCEARKRGNNNNNNHEYDYDYYEGGDNAGSEVINRRSDGYGGGGGGGGGVDVLAPLVLLAPLAGLASLYAAAAVNSNSALITLAVLNNNGGRKKRSLDLANEAEEELTASMNFMNEHRVNGTDLAHRLLVNHLTCNNLFEDYCLAKIGCLLAAERLHADQTKLILLELLRNPYLNDESKENILMGYKSTPADKNACLNFPCKL